MVDSHVLIPKLIFKNFHNERQELFYYDFENEEIKKGHAKTLYTQMGYYSDYVEDFLGKRIESPLGSVVKHIANTDFQSCEGLPKDYEETIYRYVYSLVSRAPGMVDAINKNSVFFQLLSERDRHDIAAHDGLMWSIEKKWLKDYKIGFLVNNTSERFVLPTRGAVQVGGMLLCPISPYRAFVLEKDFECDNVDENINIVPVYEIDSTEAVVYINSQAFEQERKGDKKYVVATSPQELEKLVENMK